MKRTSYLSACRGGSPDRPKVLAMFLAADPGKLQQAAEILEELINHDGGGFPEGAGEELCLEQAPVAPFRRD